MKRMLSAAIIAAVALAIPGAAAAKSHHHARHHHATHHARVRIKRFGHDVNVTSSSTTGSTTTPTAPAPAGTIASFPNGVLTITPPDASTLKAPVPSTPHLEPATTD